MTLFDYLNFLAVAKCRSITTAADLLHLTKSAVSHNLSKIEKEQSVPLFFRGSSGWELMGAGRHFCPTRRASSAPIRRSRRSSAA